MSERYCTFCSKLTECGHPTKVVSQEEQGYQFKKVVRDCECDLGMASMSLGDSTSAPTSFDFHFECLVGLVDKHEKILKG